VGILASADRGANFVPVRNATGQVYSLASASTNGDVVLVAAQTGLFLTQDGGKNWSVGDPSVAITGVAVDPANSSHLYAGTADGTLSTSTDGGTTFLPKAVRVDGPGEFVDNPNLADLLPNKKFRAPNTESIAYSEATGTLAYVYTNYDNMATQGGNIEVKTSTDQGSTWSTGQVISTSGGAPAPNDQFFPWIAASPNGAFSAIWLDCRRDPNNHDIDTFQATSRSDGATWSNSRISTVSWDPDNGFFKSGSFIGDYSGLAAADNVIYPVWTDGRNSAIAQTGIGETDIFTNVEVKR